MANFNESFHTALYAMGLHSIDGAVFYDAPMCLRFEIGGEACIYHDTDLEKNVANPSYVEGALHRAATLYDHLPAQPDLLCIKIPAFRGTRRQKQIQRLCQCAGLPLPDEQTRKRLYWNLSLQDLDITALLKEIILGDIGGNADFVSSVFFVNTAKNILFHLYDDRGADVAATDKADLHYLYERYNDWILDYDREQMQGMFEELV